MIGEKNSDIFEIFGDGGPPTHKQKFGNDSRCQRDQFRPKIVEIGAILAIFRLFEFFSKIFHLRLDIYSVRYLFRVTVRLDFDAF